jgi:hypothetical protein
MRYTVKMAGYGNPREAARVIQGIVQLSGGRFANKTNLFKAFYWAHRYYWREQDGALTRWHGIVKMPKGPGIDDFPDLLSWMEERGLIRTETSGGEYAARVFHLGEPVELSDSEFSAIRKAVRRISGRTACDVSDESHEESRSWREGDSGQPLDIYYDEIDDRSLRRIWRRLSKTRGLVDEVFGPDPG